MITEAQRLARIVGRLEHVDSLVHGIWMAAAAIDAKPERDAIRDLAHHTGETVSSIMAEILHDPKSAAPTA
jgi:hypothetical protein